MSFAFAPKGWAACNGQLLPINQNQALFSLLGTTYGGDGRVNFALPELRGRAPVHHGAQHPLGQRSGAEFHTLTTPEMPTHIHPVAASSLASDQPAPGLLGAANNVYAAGTDRTALHSETLSSMGDSQPHENRQPSMVLQWCIALQGIFPSPN